MTLDEAIRRKPVTITEADAHTHLATVCADAWDGADVPRSLIPVCEDNGAYYCINRRGGIVFHSQDGTDPSKWKDLAAWIDEVWLEAADGDEGDDDE